MKLLEQLVSEREDVSKTMTGIVDTAAEETRDLTESEETNLSELHAQAEKLDVRIKELRDIQVANLEAAKLRAEVSIGDDDDEDDVEGDNALKVRVSNEALVYAAESPNSFFRDVYNSQMNHDPQAQARISRHSEEMKVEYRDRFSRGACKSWKAIR